MSGPAILLPFAALLLGGGILAFVIMRPRPVRGDRYWRETFSQALDRKDARIDELERVIVGYTEGRAEVEDLMAALDRRQA